MIKLLNNKDDSISQSIWEVFQESYRKEADLLNLESFPPLQRTSLELKHSSTKFWGYFDKGILVGVIEIEDQPSSITISSLVVKPDFFRQGIGRQLVLSVLTSFDANNCEVQTASANIPAVALYKDVGFKEKKCWLSQDNVELILLNFEKGKQ